MKFAHILARATGTPWLINEAGGDAVMTLINSRMANPPTSVSLKDEEPAEDYGKYKGTRVLSMRGVLGKNLGMLERSCGGCDMGSVIGDIGMALRESDVERVVLRIDSPGGNAMGVPEAHAAIKDIRAQTGKEVWAFTDAYCASAAYYLAAACDGIFCTPTAQVGSIGVVTKLAFKNEQLKEQGVEVRTYKYGKFKDLGNSTRTPTKEEDAMIQATVDTLGKMFEADVRAQRPAAKDEVFEAKVYFGADAVSVGLVNEVVMNLEEMLESLVAPRG